MPPFFYVQRKVLNFLMINFQIFKLTNFQIKITISSFSSYQIRLYQKI